MTPTSTFVIADADIEIASPINDSPFLAYSDDSSDESSITSFLAPSTPIPSCLKKTNHRRRKDALRVSFGLHCNTVEPIVVYDDTWLTKDEFKMLSGRTLEDMGEARPYIRGYLHAVDAAFMHVNTDQHGRPSKESWDDEDPMLTTFTETLVVGSNLGFRGLEYFSGDAKQRRKGRSLGTTAILAKYRLLRNKSTSPASIPSQLRKYAEQLSHRSVLCARYMGMIDAMAAWEEYSTIPRLLIVPRVTPVANQRMVPVHHPKSKMMQRLFPLLDHTGRRYHRLDNSKATCRGSKNKKTTTTLFRIVVQRWKAQEGMAQLHLDDGASLLTTVEVRSN